MYAGVDGSDDTGEPMAEPDMLAYADEAGVHELGPEQATVRVELCRYAGDCEFAEFCLDHGGVDAVPQEGVWVECP
jgi:hypothetical protein